jgi:hypothetical protein
VSVTDPLSQATLTSVVDPTTSSHSRGGGMEASADVTAELVATSGQRAVATSTSEDAGQLVADVYHAHELSLVRIALLLVGDRATAEDVV